jgi:hypothetical protein
MSSSTALSFDLCYLTFPSRRFSKNNGSRAAHHDDSDADNGYDAADDDGQGQFFPEKYLAECDAEHWCH